MQYWLFKSEPFKWSWEQQKAKGDAGEEWDGIRNYQARNFMRTMEIGDLAFFYHSNEGLEEVKANEKLSDMSLVTSMRLSVQPVKEEEWIEVCRMGGLDGKTLKDL